MSGIGAGIAALNMGARLVGAKAALAKIPPKVWYALAIVAALVAAFFIHQHHAHKALKDADAAGYQRAKDEDAKALAALKARVATVTVNGAKISQDERTKNDADNRNIHAAAGTLSLRGPGASSCRPVRNPAVPPASGGDGPANRPADAADGQLSIADGESDLAAVPWRWLVSNSEERDLDRAEVLTWRDWYTKQAAEWEKLRADSVKLEPQTLSKHANPGGK